MKKRCSLGKSCGAACVSQRKKCRVEISRQALGNVSELVDRMSKAYDRNRRKIESSAVEPDYSQWKTLAQGYNGKVSISPDGKRVVKQLLVGDNGKKGEFGEFEIELAIKMGELGHSPRVYRANADVIEMDLAKGKTLWTGYTRGENEPAMNAAQATNAAAAIKSLHKMRFAHGDMHALQFLVDGNDVKMVDFGLSILTSRQPSRVMQDLAKISKLVQWENPELEDNPYVQLVNRHLSQYREVKGVSKAAKAKREQIAQEYLRELENLE